MSTIAPMGIEANDLLKRATEGDQSAWDEIVKKYERLVWHVLLGCGLSESDAADVHQTTWLRLAENMSNIRNPERLGAWLATTARRECQRVSAARSREMTIELDVELPSLGASPDELLLANERAAAIWRAFSDLPPSCQKLLRLLLAEPAFTYEEISELLDIPIGSIGPTRGRCVARLGNSPHVISLGERK